MKSLVLNSGSSSIKFAVFDADREEKVYSGQVEGIGTPQGNLIFKTSEGKEETPLENPDHSAALRAIEAALTAKGITQDSLLGVGHRVVHGGEKFSGSMQITQEIIETIEELIELAPLHNPANLLGIQAMEKVYPGLPQVGVFDTAFHQSIPPKAYLYPIPYDLYDTYKIRRYGFHGISFEYIQSRIADFTGTEKSSYLVAHLGNGCSATAVKEGKSVDTTMGLTPLEGLVMGTRSGTVDPGLHHYLHEKFGWDFDQVNKVLNKESGLLGLSGLSQDMRTVLEAVPTNKNAAMAFEIFCFRLAKMLFGLAASLTKLDGIVFTGGVGENSKIVREKVIEQMSLLGFQMDIAKNNALPFGGEGNVAKEGSPAILVIPTDEELMIARKIKSTLKGE